ELEVELELPDVEDEPLVDAQVELEEGLQAARQGAGRGRGDVDVARGVEVGGLEGGERVAGGVAHAGPEAPAGAEGDAGDEGDHVGLVCAVEALVAAGAVGAARARQGVAEPAVDGRRGEAHEQLGASDPAGPGAVDGRAVEGTGGGDEVVEGLVEALKIDLEDVADAAPEAEVDVGRALGV